MHVVSTYSSEATTVISTFPSPYITSKASTFPHGNICILSVKGRWVLEFFPFLNGYKLRHLNLFCGFHGLFICLANNWRLWFKISPPLNNPINTRKICVVIISFVAASKRQTTLDNHSLKHYLWQHVVACCSEVILLFHSLSLFRSVTHFSLLSKKKTKNCFIQ